jgi:hypothetical protein
VSPQTINVSSFGGETFISFGALPIPLGSIITLGYVGTSNTTVVSGGAAFLDIGNSSGFSVTTNFASSASDNGEAFTAYAQLVVTDPLNVTMCFYGATTSLNAGVVLYGNVFHT